MVTGCGGRQGTGDGFRKYGTTGLAIPIRKEKPPILRLKKIY
jgi:hypothetical protein